ncbi:hypothetical protein D6865_06500, partial [Acinetobacter baumannii]
MYAPCYRHKHTLFLKECERIKLISVQINCELHHLSGLSVNFKVSKKKFSTETLNTVKNINGAVVDK